MSKVTELAEFLEHNTLLEPYAVHLRALDASHRQLLEALENLLNVHECEGGTTYHAGDIARTAIAAAKELA